MSSIFIPQTNQVASVGHGVNFADSDYRVNAAILPEALIISDSLQELDAHFIGRLACVMDAVQGFPPVAFDNAAVIVVVIGDAYDQYHISPLASSSVA